MRETDGQAGTSYHVKCIELPSGAVVTGDELRDLSKSKAGRLKLEKTLADVRANPW